MLRVIKSVASSGITSLISLVLSISIARNGGVDGLGEFGIAFAVLSLIQVAAREAGITPLLGEQLSGDVVRNHSRRQSLIGLVAMFLLAGTGVIFALPLMVIIGLGVHGTLMFNYSKIIDLTLGKGDKALLKDLVIFILVVITAVNVDIFDLDYELVVAVWVAAGSMIGYLGSIQEKLSLRPSWVGRGEESRVGIGFAIQSVIGSGSVQLLTLLLALVSGPTLVGTLRGGSTLLGPANLIATAVQPLAIRKLATVRHTYRRKRLVLIAKLSVALVGIYCVVSVATVVLSNHLGSVLLGNVWNEVKPILVILAVDGVLASLCIIPVAAHRALWASRRSLHISIIVLVIRVPAVTIGATVWGVQGAAWGYLISTAFSALCWWFSAATIPPRVKE